MAFLNEPYLSQKENAKQITRMGSKETSGKGKHKFLAAECE